ncbi:glutamate-5-semialdehyde dehydrogenase [Granulicella rosea]|uniref:Gamma-glutamyl phosphate reductase n=1 Tax=Granulicella rosea TaxID=474952 RepID=A0A239LC09_9BACT|nr:glutamate-5-semialdehyde dehydrogenase [Granulicella rosea]SNT27074.1 glutamate-5-semialdehyde dehydrogenase [Granulicella rosea]
MSTLELAQAAKAASHTLAVIPADRRNEALERMAQMLEENAEQILAANAADVEVALGLLERGELSSATVNRLRLSPQKLAEMAASVRATAALPEVTGKVLERVELDEGLELEKVSVPLGVLAVIFEARPDAVTQISALALKSGNTVILKPGKEVEQTATVLVGLIRQALIEKTLPEGAVSLVLGRAAVAELLGMTELIDLVIPRGSKQLVQYVQANTRIPVLGHAEGICHIFVDEAVDAELALAVIADAKTDYPSACNAVETVLVHRAVAAEFLPKLAERMAAAKVLLLGSDEAATLAGQVGPVGDWNTEYGDLTLAVQVVADMDEAIVHIHRYGSGHTESIMTTDASHAERFLREVDAAGVYHNVSTRFADGFRYGFGAEVGVSTSKIHARGPVGLDGLTTYKYLLRGSGQLVGSYHGRDARPFTHVKKPV